MEMANGISIGTDFDDLEWSWIIVTHLFTKYRFIPELAV